MNMIQEKVYLWFLENKNMKLLIEQVNGLIEAFEDGENNRFISDMKRKVSEWTGVDLKDFEVRSLDNLI